MNDPEKEKIRENEPPQPEYEQVEQNLHPSGHAQKPTITLQQAIDFGEYNPEYLARFEEWHTLTPHIQWQLIRKALDIHKKQLATQYNELCSALDLRLKTEVQESIRAIERQLAHLAKEKERLYVAFTNKMIG